jgi:TolA-binding protein
MPASYPSQSLPQYHERDVVTEWPRVTRPPSPKTDPFTNKKRSTGKRMVRALFRWITAVLIGVGGTLAWQSHGEEAKEMVRTWAPSLAWLLPASTTSSVDGQASAAAGITSAELVQQLKPVTLDLAIVRHGVDQLATTIKQLAAKQEEMAQEIATLQATEQDIREKISSPPQPRTVAPRRTPQSTGQSSATQPSPAPSPSSPPLRLDGPAR